MAKIDESLVDALFREGNTCKDIARLLGVSHTGVHKAAVRLGLPTGRYKPEPRYCSGCGKGPLTKEQRKFCSSSCSARASNQGRKRFYGDPARRSERDAEREVRRRLRHIRAAARALSGSRVLENGLRCCRCSEALRGTQQLFCSKACRFPELSPEERLKRTRTRRLIATRKYQARRYHQTPPDADPELIRKIYENCPEGFEVDHIIPISKGGLHHQDNLQYLTIRENRSKGSKIHTGS